MRRLFFERGLFERRKRGLQLPRDLLGDVTLDGENVGQIAIVTLCPSMRVRSRIDELSGHPDPVAGAAHASFEHIRNAEGAADLTEIAVRARAVTHHAGA